MITHRCRPVAPAVVVLIWTSSFTAAQSMQRDGYVLPPASVQDLFNRDKNIAALDLDARRGRPDGQPHEQQGPVP